MNLKDVKFEIAEMLEIIDNCPVQENFKINDISKKQDETINILYEKLDKLHNQIDEDLKNE
ncbi:MAG: hypothetical protein ACFFDN_09195 [Candidatus Hodarchaeota archaeon]